MAKHSLNFLFTFEYRIPKSEQLCLRIYKKNELKICMFGRFKVSTVSLSRNLIFIETVIIEWNVKYK